MKENSQYYKRIVVDFDDTLSFTLNRDWENSQPNLPLIEKINKLYDEGYEIIILTARGQISCDGDWLRADLKYRNQIEDWLKKHGVKYHELSFQKILAQYYIDDKAVLPNDFLNVTFVNLQGGKSGANIKKIGDFVYKTDDNCHNVIKWYNIVENYNQIKIPKVYSLIGKTIKMEYIENTYNFITPLLKDIIDSIKKISSDNFSDFNTYISRINDHIELHDELHTKDTSKFLKKLKDNYELFNKEKSFCHGDLSLDNIINNEKGSYLIDPIYNEDLYSSWLLDVSKFIHSCRKRDKFDLVNLIYDTYYLYRLELTLLEITQWIRILKYEKDLVLYNKYLSITKRLIYDVVKDS